MMSDERMGAIVETMELLANPEFMEALGKYKAGNLKRIPLKEAKF